MSLAISGSCRCWTRPVSVCAAKGGGMLDHSKVQVRDVIFKVFLHVKQFLCNIKITENLIQQAVCDTFRSYFPLWEAVPGIRNLMKYFFEYNVLFLKKASQCLAVNTLKKCNTRDEGKGNELNFKMWFSAARPKEIKRISYFSCYVSSEDPFNRWFLISKRQLHPHI